MLVKLPFSQRTPGSRWIQDDFQDSARIALLHFLHDLVERNYQYVHDWIDIDREIRVEKTDRARCNINDPNGWSCQSGKPRYIPDLMLGIITLSFRNVEIVERPQELKVG